MPQKFDEWWDGISLRTMVTGVTVVLLTLGLLVSGMGTSWLLRSYLVEQVDSQLLLAANDPDAELGSATNGQGGESPGESHSKFFWALYDGNGHLVTINKRTGPEHIPASFPFSETMEMSGRIIVINATGGPNAWHATVVPQQFTDGSMGTLMVALPMAETENLMTRYASIFFGFGTIVVLGAAVLTRFLVTRTFTPLREVERTAAAIADGDFSQRLAGSTNPSTEVGRLNQALNTMLGRIDRAFTDRARTIDQMRRFVGDASHELRTPLVTVRGYAELYRMGALDKPEDVAQAMERIEKEAIRMGVLVEDLLQLARLDEARPLDLAPLDIQPLMRDAALDTRAQAPDRVVTVAEPIRITSPDAPVAARPPAHSTPTGPIAFAGARLSRFRALRVAKKPNATLSTGEVEALRTPMDNRPIMVLAEENKIRQVLTNLIGNALRFTPEGSPIELRATVDEPAGLAVIEVIDHGEGIPEQIREKIFQRFWRADSSRTRETGGSGLGLAIVSAIAQAHGGSVTAVETPGGGATLQLRLPLLPDTTDAGAIPAAVPTD